MNYGFLGPGGLRIYYQNTETFSTQTAAVISGASYILSFSGTGTVTNVSSSSGDITITNSTTTPQLTVVSAPKLTTARTIAGVSFNGTANISLNNNAITNILVTNIRDAQDNPIYRETAGPRSGRSTIYEIAALEPIVGPFGNVEYYQMVFRKTENQTTGD
jgi:hypothetical protein